jgi:hypothetical protein
VNMRKIVQAPVRTEASNQMFFRFITRTQAVAYRSRIILLGFIFTAVGCESIVVRPRPDVDRREIERTPAERPPDVRDSAKTEIIGTVERVDKIKNEIQLRTTEAKVIVIKYDPATVVYSRERQVGIEALRLRDLILVRVAKTSQGEQYADLIRLNDRKEQ